MSLRLRVLVAAAVMLSGCELREITLATPEDIVIAEVVLRAGHERQTAYLHRTSTGESSARVYGARIIVTEIGSGTSFEMDVAPDGTCLSPEPDPSSPSTGTCYAAFPPQAHVWPGLSYVLRIELPGGGVLTGSTTVPGDFALTVPAASPCFLPADTVLDVVWTRAVGTAVYITEASMAGLREALRSRGVSVPGAGQVQLLGFSVTAEDTTLAFPSELGLFDRFDDELHPILVALRTGLPPDVFTRLSVSATDRNYVNWVRGGNFNPSGLVRISSLRGPGAGVFGSMVTREADIFTGSGSAPADLPACR